MHGSMRGNWPGAFLERCSDIHSNEHFVLNHKDRAPAQCGEFYGGT
jgi:hypothetical protein